MRSRALTALALFAALMGLAACDGGKAATMESPGSYSPIVQEREVEADGVTLHSRIAGKPEAGEVLIAIHGGPGNSSSYMQSLEQLASDGLAIVTYDQRGTGGSSDPAGSYGMPAYVADLEAIRQAIGAETVHLLGHSWGGIVALRYAASHPQRVDSIVLGGSGVLTPEAAEAGRASRSQRIGSLQEQGIIPSPITSLRDILPAYFSDPGFEMPDELRNMEYTPAVEEMTWSALAGYDFTQALDTLHQPVLVLWGEDDPFGMAYVDATKQTLQAAELEVVILEDCGHYWHECPDEFLSQVRSFLGPAGNRDTGQ